MCKKDPTTFSFNIFTYEVLSSLQWRPRLVPLDFLATKSGHTSFPHTAQELGVKYKTARRVSKVSKSLLLEHSNFSPLSLSRKDFRLSVHHYNLV